MKCPKCGGETELTPVRLLTLREWPEDLRELSKRMYISPGDIRGLPEKGREVEVCPSCGWRQPAEK